MKNIDTHSLNRKLIENFHLFRNESKIHSNNKDDVSTEGNFVCVTDVLFLRTENNDTQLPHVDYPWM